MSLVVADTTPLSCLLRIGRTDLLGALFSDLRIPIAVADELDRGGALVGDWRQCIAAARPLVAQVRSDGGLWVTEKLVAEILKRVGE